MPDQETRNYIKDMLPPVIRFLLAAEQKAMIGLASDEAGNKCLTKVLQEWKGK
jgi:hypothetical protein